MEHVGKSTQVSRSASFSYRRNFLQPDLGNLRSQIDGLGGLGPNAVLRFRFQDGLGRSRKLISGALSAAEFIDISAPDGVVYLKQRRHFVPESSATRKFENPAMKQRSGEVGWA